MSARLHQGVGFGIGSSPLFLRTTYPGVFISSSESLEPPILVCGPPALGGSVLGAGGAAALGAAGGSLGVGPGAGGAVPAGGAGMARVL